MSYDPRTHQARVTAIHDRNSNCYWLQGHRDLHLASMHMSFSSKVDSSVPGAVDAYQGMPVIVARDPTHWAQLLLLEGANGYALEEIVL